MVEKCLPKEELREERNCLHKVRFLLTFSSPGEEKKMFEKLGKNPEFQKVYKQGRSKANKYLVMYVKTGESGPSRYGFSVSKKVGNSVVRHHITRLLRESVRKNDALVKEGNRIIIVARKDVKNKNFKEVDGAVFHLLKIHGILK